MHHHSRSEAGETLLSFGQAQDNATTATKLLKFFYYPNSESRSKSRSGPSIFQVIHFYKPSPHRAHMCIPTFHAEVLIMTYPSIPGFSGWKTFCSPAFRAAFAEVLPMQAAAPSHLLTPDTSSIHALKEAMLTCYLLQPINAVWLTIITAASDAASSTRQ